MIQFDQVSKRYNGFTALSNINLVIDDSEFVFLIGTSGAGKT
ncbi:phosphonate ABC transporter ATP-binding protein, partial [Patescibacteria group bacterium]|nr:phosphonate ABC transporter ATP-binding protein [Patescibacteria group bacterium]